MHDYASVECVALENTHGRSHGASPDLRLGHHYPLLEIVFGEQGVLFRVPSGDGTTFALWPSANFRVLRAPRAWTGHVDGPAFELTPSSLADVDWHLYFDDESDHAGQVQKFLDDYVHGYYAQHEALGI